MEARRLSRPIIPAVPVLAHALTPHPTMCVEPEPLTYDAGIEAEVARIWGERQAASSGRLFDGPVYGVAGIAPDRLVLRPGQFRHALARCLEPELRHRGLDIRQAAVSGLLLCPEGLVLGRRAGSVATDAGRWEPPPSGGLDRPDPVAQIHAELREELGLTPADLDETRLIGALEQTDTGLVDLLLCLTTPLPFALVDQRWRQTGSDEYSALRVVPQTALPDLAASANAVPLLRPMLALAGLI